MRIEVAEWIDGVKLGLHEPTVPWMLAYRSSSEVNRGTPTVQQTGVNSRTFRDARSSA